MQKTIEEQKIDSLRFVNRLLEPEDLGLAVSAEVRDLAREVIGLNRVETEDKHG
jgi:hypothetical protein